MVSFAASLISVKFNLILILYHFGEFGVEAVPLLGEGSVQLHHRLKLLLQLTNLKKKGLVGYVLLL